MHRRDESLRDRAVVASGPFVPTHALRPRYLMHDSHEFMMRHHAWELSSLVIEALPRSLCNLRIFTIVAICIAAVYGDISQSIGHLPTPRSILYAILLLSIVLFALIIVIWRQHCVARGGLVLTVATLLHVVSSVLKELELGPSLLEPRVLDRVKEQMTERARAYLDALSSAIDDGTFDTEAAQALEASVYTLRKYAFLSGVDHLIPLQRARTAALTRPALSIDALRLCVNLYVLVVALLAWPALGSVRAVMLAIALGYAFGILFAVEDDLTRVFKLVLRVEAVSVREHAVTLTMRAWKMWDALTPWLASRP